MSQVFNFDATDIAIIRELRANGRANNQQIAETLGLIHEDALGTPSVDFMGVPMRRNDEVVGGAPYGATTIANGDGSRQPSETELEGARYLGRRVAETAQKLFG